MKRIYKFLVILALLAGNNPLFCENKVIIEQKKWEYVTTKHFKIYYYPESRQLLPVLTDILEDVFSRTTRFYEYAPLGKIPFFIYRDHNDFEQTNIADIGEGTGGVTEALKNRFLVFSDGSIRWLNNVISHEFAHEMYFTLIYEESPILKALRLARGIFIPLWFVEGLAEYNTGNIDATAREMMIRDMVYNKSVISIENLSSFNHLKPHQVTPAYKLSDTAIRFIVDEYGNDKPQKILKSLREKMDTDPAFEDVINNSLWLFEKKWEEWIYEQYEDKVKNFRQAADYGREITADGGDNIPDFNTDPAVSPDGKSIAYITDEDGINKLVITDIRGKNKRVIAEGNNRTIDIIHNDKISFSPDGEILAFSGEKTQKDYIYLCELKTDRISRLPLDIFTVKSPSFSPNGEKIAFIGMKTVYSDIYEYYLKNGTAIQITDDPEDQGSPSYSPDGNFLVFTQESPAALQSDIYLMDLKNNNKIRITDSPGNDASPSFSPDGKQIIYTSDGEPGMPVNIYTISLGDSRIKRETNLLNGAFFPVFTPDGNSVCFSYYNNFRQDLYLVNVSSFDGAAVSTSPYSGFSQGESTGAAVSSLVAAPYRFKPSLDILVPFLMYHSEYGLFLATYWQASELFGDHEISSQIMYLSETGDLQYSFGYSYKKWRPQFQFSLEGENSETLSEFEEIYKERQHAQSLSVIYPFDRFNDMELDLSTNKYYEKNTTLDMITADERTNIYTVAYDRNTTTGKYMYARYGSNLRMLFRNAVKKFDGDYAYRECAARYEKYFPAFSQSALVLGTLGITSEGDEKRYFRLPLRGFSHADDEYCYNRLIAATLEYRFPLITLENVWPSSDFFIKSVNCFCYTDNGIGFNSSDEFIRLKTYDIQNSVGSGLRLYSFVAGYLLPVTVDYAKKTNDSTGRWNFMLGVSLPF